MTSKESITFVCCVESGWLESCTIRMIESLRRWGGRLSNAPVIAITPRFGAELSADTLKFFEKRNVEYRRFLAPNKYAWKGFLNKHYALLEAESNSKSEIICWLDSDLLILQEPTLLLLESGKDFAACTPDANGATTGLGDPMEPFWMRACELAGVSIEELPWVETELERKQVRFYFNSGVFAYRRSTGFAQEHLYTTLKCFDNYLASKITSTFFTQYTLGISAFRNNMSWCSLPHSYNYSMGSKTYEDWYRSDDFKQAKIVHYHDAMWPGFWSIFIKNFNEVHPSVAQWLLELGPLNNTAPLHWRLMNKGLEVIRKKQERDYNRQCRFL
jgi:hypothetical protein